MGRPSRAAFMEENLQNPSHMSNPAESQEKNNPYPFLPGVNPAKPRYHVN